MNVELPSEGCNYFSNASQFTNYHNNSARTYIINEGKPVLIRTQTYNTVPSGANCLHTGDIVWNPEFLVYSQFMSIILCALIGVLLWKTIGRLLGR